MKVGVESNEWQTINIKQEWIFFKLNIAFIPWPRFTTFLRTALLLICNLYCKNKIGGQTAASKSKTLRAKVMGNQKIYQIEDCLKNKRYCKNSKKFAFRYWCFMKDRIRVTARYRSILRITDLRLWEMKTLENDKICPSKYPAAVAHHTLHLFVSLSRLSVSGNLLWHH